jgi:hypothetical protein
VFAISGVEAEDAPFDAGGALMVSWDRFSGVNFHEYRVYANIVDFSSVVGLIPSATIDTSGTNTTSITTANGAQLVDNLDYWVAVTRVSLDLIENTTVWTAGPVQSQDNIPPPGLIVELSDEPLDLGGRLRVNWTLCEEADFAHYEVYLENFDFDSVSDKVPDETVDQRLNNSIVVGGLEDGAQYWAMVVAVDTSGNHVMNVDAVGPVRPVSDPPQGGDGDGDDDPADTSSGDDGVLSNPLALVGLGMLIMVIIVVIALSLKKKPPIDSYLLDEAYSYSVSEYDQGYMATDMSLYGATEIPGSGFPGSEFPGSEVPASGVPAGMPGSGMPAVCSLCGGPGVYDANSGTWCDNCKQYS